MDLAFYNKGRLHYSILFLLFFIGLGLLWQWLFRITFHENYVQRCLEFGPPVLIFNALITAIWSGFDEKTDLVSANPLIFAGGWLLVGAIIALSFTNALERVFIGEDAPAKWEQVRERIFCVIVACVVFALAYAWLLCAMPFLYFIFLLSASPVRLSLAAKNPSVIYNADKVLVTEAEEVLVTEGKGTKKVEHAGFSEKPVASAFALSALMTVAISLIVHVLRLVIPG